MFGALSKRFSKHKKTQTKQISLPCGKRWLKSYRASITTLNTDAIVNCVDREMKNIGGVSKCIFDAAGRGFQDKCKEKLRQNFRGSMQTSDVLITDAGKLPCKYVLHAVGPAWKHYSDKTQCLEHLYDTVLNVLLHGERLNCSAIAIPGISSGTFGVPKDKCANIYIASVLNYFEHVPNSSFKEVHIVDMNAGIIEEVQKRIEERRTGDQSLSLELFPNRLRNIEQHYSSLFVAAIDIGLTFSGYAFSSKADFSQEPLRFTESQSQRMGMMFNRIPSSILLSPDRSFSGYGFKAEEMFVEMQNDVEKNIDDYIFIRNFHGILHELEDLTDASQMQDTRGNDVNVACALAMFISHLKEELFERIQNSATDITQSDVHYVLTVPSTWGANATLLIMESAKQAGITEDQLYMIPGPEAASTYCQNQNPDFKEAVEAGKMFMVVDVGGGMVDIRIYQYEQQHIQSLGSDLSLQWGASKVDSSFVDFFEEIFGKQNIDKLKEENYEDFLDLYAEFESKKQTISENKQHYFISIPGPLKMTLEDGNMDLDEMLRSSKYAGKVQQNKKKQKLKIQADVFHRLFKPTIKKITRHIKGILCKRQFTSMEYILVIGGFSKCELLRNKMTKKFPMKHLIIPNDPEMATVKGAVLWGHKKEEIV